MGQQPSFIWPALGQRPSGLARQRRAGRSAADGACRAPASPELLAWPRGRIKPGAGLILAGSRFALGSADVPPAETPRRPPGPAVNGYRLHVVAGAGQVDHALATGPGQAVPAVSRRRPPRLARARRDGPRAVPVTPTRAPTFSACRTPTVMFRISPLAWPRWERTSAPALPRVPLRGRCAGETVGSWAERALVPAGSSA
jgi:hypothetical protein